MRNVLIASLIGVSTLLAGCLCGGYEGGGNRVYERNGSEMMILCENGGFVATTASTMLEGRYTHDESGNVIGVRGEDGQIAFDLIDNDDGTATTPQLGDTPWTELSLDITALDHSNVLCDDLEFRSWWTQQ